MNQKKIALIGNPNSGKTTLYNRLTGLSAREGNYSGITINTEDGFWQSSSLADGEWGAWHPARGRQGRGYSAAAVDSVVTKRTGPNTDSTTLLL